MQSFLRMKLIITLFFAFVFPVISFPEDAPILPLSFGGDVVTARAFVALSRFPILDIKAVEAVGAPADQQF
jgi:hypothetical protein